jgi:hypothetical protein
MDFISFAVQRLTDQSSDVKEASFPGFTAQSQSNNITILGSDGMGGDYTFSVSLENDNLSVLADRTESYALQFGYILQNYLKPLAVKTSSFPSMASRTPTSLCN